MSHTAENDRSILAVDDAPTNLQIINGLLKDEYKLYLAKSGRLALFALRHTTPDLILLDIEMSDISGFEIMEVMNRNERLKAIPVIFVTALTSKDTIFMAGRLGAADYVLKPFEPDLLRAKIYNALKTDKSLSIRETDNPGSVPDADGKPDPIPTYFDINDFYTDIVSSHSPAAEAKGLIFQSDIASALPHIIFGNELLLRQIVTNILGNVIQDTSEGYVGFSLELLTEDATEYLACVMRGNMKAPQTHMANDLARMMGGEICFTNAHGNDSAFTVKIPLIRDESAKARQTAEINKVMVKPGVRVLVVDDNPVNLKIAEAMLSKHGIASETAQNGEECLHLIKEERFNLIFMDHIMYGMDGTETAKAIRALEGEYFSGVPIIALSAYTDENARELFLKSGMNDFVPKPIRDRELNAVLKNWLPRKYLMDTRAFTAERTAGSDETELSERLNRISVASGQELSIVSGLKSVGGDKKLYIEILTQFFQWIDNDMRLLAESVQYKRWNDYAVRMHALKTVFANIGNQLMSGWATSLEKAAKEGDIKKCVKETEFFLANIKKLHSRLAAVLPAQKDEEAGGKNTVSPDKLMELLRALSEACLSCSADQAHILLSEFRRFTFGDDMDGYLSQISGFINSFDFDKAYDICRKATENYSTQFFSMSHIQAQFL